MAFIVDIRRGNLLQHLMYKAMFELSADRAEFVSRLFSQAAAGRPRTATSTVVELFAALRAAWRRASELYRQNVAAIATHLTKTHGFPLSAGRPRAARVDLLRVLLGRPEPALLDDRPSGFGGRGFGSSFPTYEELMMQTDWDGAPRSYLATEDELPVHQGPAGAEPDRAGRGRLCRAQGAAGGRPVLREHGAR